MEEAKLLNGKLVVEMVEGEAAVKLEGDCISCAHMIGAAIETFYELALDNVKEDVENPEEAIKNRIHELVDIALGSANTKRKLEECRLRAKNAKSSTELLELMLEMAEVVRKHTTGDKK